MIGAKQNSGKVSWDESQIKWENPGFKDLIIKLNNVVIVGEYISNIGPYSDWFITFVYCTGDWDNIPVQAKGVNLLRQYLSKVYNTDFSKSFGINSFRDISFIRFPQILEGKNLFILPAKRIVNRPKIIDFFSGWSFSWSFNDCASEYLDPTKNKKMLFELTKDAKGALKNID